MNLIPTFRSFNGEGKPRVLILKDRFAFQSLTSEVYTATTAAGYGDDGTRKIIGSDNRDFETTAGDWTGVNNHSFSRTTINPISGIGSGLITATGAGSQSANHVVLPSTKFHLLVVGKRYMIQLLARSDTANTTITIALGANGQAFTSGVLTTVVGQSTKVNFVFVAETNDIAVSLRLFLNQIANVRIDDIAIYENLTNMAKVNDLISSFKTVGAVDKPTYAKITAVNVDTVTVDAWTLGTPTDGKQFTIGGLMIDLPRTEEMTETFEPNVLVHSLFRGRKEIKQFGWNYTCTLDYTTYVQPDQIIDMQKIFDARDVKHLVLIPRVDASQHQYNVYYTNPVEFAKFGRTPGYKKLMLVFAGKEMLASLPLKTGYGTGYALSYGKQL